VGHALQVFPALTPAEFKPLSAGTFLPLFCAWLISSLILISVRFAFHQEYRSSALAEALTTFPRPNRSQFGQPEIDIVPTIRNKDCLHLTVASYPDQEHSLRRRSAHYPETSAQWEWVFQWHR
jgi:hypothetical protein